MAKSALRIKARQLRSEGESVKSIAKKLGVSKSSASIWVRDVILTVEQLERLKNRSVRGAELGGFRGALVQKERRLQVIQKFQEDGITKLADLSNREFLIAGVALYWAEGSKRNRTLYICNSDPRLINFMIKWLNQFFDVKNSDLRPSVGINEIHREREEKVKRYWSKTTGIPLNQFWKTSFKKNKAEKIYTNLEEHYGTLGIHVLKGTTICYRILGLIEALSRQGSSVG